MRQTLIAVFEKRGDAQHALNKLLAAGFLLEDATLSIADPAGHVLALTTESEEEAGRAIGLVGRLAVDDGDIAAAYYRAHWKAQHAPAAVRKQAHALASAHADKSRDSFQIHMRHWTAHAADRKASWALRHPGDLSPWERFKDALLHGWSRIDLGDSAVEDNSPPIDHRARYTSKLAGT